jgi:homospermidine synthase
MTWCNQNNVLYIDTSLEPWAEHYSLESVGEESRTYYAAHAQAKHISQTWKKQSSTCLTTHGANPGVVNYFVKSALLILAKELKLNSETPATREQWAELCMRSGTKVIHISENDTQTTKLIKPEDEFWNTWSIPSFRGELLASAEIGWGTHEKTMPKNASGFSSGPKNSIYLKQMSAAALIKTWGPISGSFTGFIVPHSETITLSNYFTVWRDGEAIYRPTVLFAYRPSPSAIQSLNEMLANNGKLHPKLKIINKEIETGCDELGALLLGHPKNALWYGSELSIEEARQNIPGQNATTVQVVAGLISGITWVLNNPQQGYSEPENLPHEEILKIAEPYLQPIKYCFSNWNPQSASLNNQSDLNEMWQFNNFMVSS